MSKPRIPTTTPAASRLLERYADDDGQIARIEAVRSARIAAINADCDAEAAPLVKQRDDLAAVLNNWFFAAGKALLPNGRKSMELGGCMIGSRTGRATLRITGEEEDVAAALSGLRWAKALLRIKTSLNRTALLTSIDGKHKMALAELGVTRQDGEEQFFVERAEQAGTIGS